MRGGAVAQRDVIAVLTEGLKRLEYRGYDSCGVAVLQGDTPRRVRSVERVAREMPVVTIAPNDVLLEKPKSNMQEVRARSGELFVLADADSEIASSEHVHVIRMPKHYGRLSPILHVVPLQLLSYHTACIRGIDVDKPRNLAKAVTVE